MKHFEIRFTYTEPRMMFGRLPAETKEQAIEALNENLGHLPDFSIVTIEEVSPDTPLATSADNDTPKTLN